MKIFSYEVIASLSNMISWTFWSEILIFFKMKTLSATQSKNYFLTDGDIWICHPCLGIWIWIWIDLVCHSFTSENGIEMKIWNALSLNGVEIKICVSSFMEQKFLSSPCSCPSLCLKTGCCCLSCWRMMNVWILASSLVAEIPSILRVAQVSPHPLNLKVTCGHFHGLNFWAHLTTLFPRTSLEDLWA